MTVQVNLHAITECVAADEAGEHVNDARTLVVGDAVENLVDFVRVVHLDLDGVRGRQGVVIEGGAEGVAVGEAATRGYL